MVHARLAVPVVARPRLGVRQDVVRLREPLELGRRLRVPRVLVRVEAPGQEVVALLDLGLAGLPRHAQQRVVIVAGRGRRGGLQALPLPALPGGAGALAVLHREGVARVLDPPPLVVVPRLLLLDRLPDGLRRVGEPPAHLHHRRAHPRQRQRHRPRDPQRRPFGEPFAALLERAHRRGRHQPDEPGREALPGGLEPAAQARGRVPGPPQGEQLPGARLGQAPEVPRRAPAAGRVLPVHRPHPAPPAGRAAPSRGVTSVWARRPLQLVGGGRIEAVVFPFSFRPSKGIHGVCTSPGPAPRPGASNHIPPSRPANCCPLQLPPRYGREGAGDQVQDLQAREGANPGRQRRDGVGARVQVRERRPHLPEAGRQRPREDAPSPTPGVGERAARS